MTARQGLALTALLLLLWTFLLMLEAYGRTLLLLEGRTRKWLAAERDLVETTAELRDAWRLLNRQPPDEETPPAGHAGGAVAGAEGAAGG